MVVLVLASAATLVALDRQEEDFIPEAIAPTNSVLAQGAISSPLCFIAQSLEYPSRGHPL